MDNKKEIILNHINQYKQEISNMKECGEGERELCKYFEAKVSGLELAIEILEGRWE